jgi:hypothetical protein
MLRRRVQKMNFTNQGLNYLLSNYDKSLDNETYNSITVIKIKSIPRYQTRLTPYIYLTSDANNNINLADVQCDIEYLNLITYLHFNITGNNNAN